MGATEKTHIMAELILYGPLSPVQLLPSIPASAAEVPPSVKRIVVRGHLTSGAWRLLASICKSREAPLDSISFEYCGFVNAREWRYEYKLLFKATSLEFKRCTRVSWALIHLADPATVRDVSVWCCLDDVVPNAGLVKQAPAVWGGLRRLVVEELPRPRARYDQTLNFVPVLGACHALEELVVMLPNGNGSMYDYDRPATWSLPGLRTARIWNGNNTLDFLEAFVGRIPAYPAVDLVVAPFDAGAARTELAAERSALEDQRRAQPTDDGTGGGSGDDARRTRARKGPTCYEETNATALGRLSGDAPDEDEVDDDYIVDDVKVMAAVTTLLGEIYAAV